MPPNVSFESAASLPSAIATAAIGLYGDKADSGAKQLSAPWKEGEGQYNGQPIVIFGGSGSVGQSGELVFSSKYL